MKAKDAIYWMAWILTIAGICLVGFGLMWGWALYAIGLCTTLIIIFPELIALYKSYYYYYLESMNDIRRR